MDAGSEATKSTAVGCSQVLGGICCLVRELVTNLCSQLLKMTLKGTSPRKCKDVAVHVGLTRRNGPLCIDQDAANARNHCVFSTRDEISYTTIGLDDDVPCSGSTC